MKFVYLNEAKRVKDLEDQLARLRFQSSKARYEQDRAYTRFIKDELEIERLNGIIKGLRAQMAYVQHKYNITQIDVMECKRFEDEYNFKIDFGNKKYEDLTEDEKKPLMMDCKVVLTKKDTLDKKKEKA